MTIQIRPEPWSPATAHLIRTWATQACHWARNAGRARFTLVVDHGRKYYVTVTR